jgi:hypothetical protein
MTIRAIPGPVRGITDAHTNRITVRWQQKGTEYRCDWRAANQDVGVADRTQRTSAMRNSTTLRAEPDNVELEAAGVMT